MSLSRVSQAIAAAASVTLGTHAAGDLILIAAIRFGNDTPPTNPGGWTDLNATGANGVSGRVAFKIAASASEVSGTWTNADGIIALVYRSTTGFIDAGAVAVLGGSSAIIQYPALTLEDSDGSSWVVGFAGHLTATNVEQAPTGMTNINSIVPGAEGEIASHDTNAGVASWSQQDVTVNDIEGWRAWTVEVVELPVPNENQRWWW